MYPLFVYKIILEVLKFRWGKNDCIAFSFFCPTHLAALRKTKQMKRKNWRKKGQIIKTSIYHLTFPANWLILFSMVFLRDFFNGCAASNVYETLISSRAQIFCFGRSITNSSSPSIRCLSFFFFSFLVSFLFLALTSGS